MGTIDPDVTVGAASSQGRSWRSSPRSQMTPQIRLRAMTMTAVPNAIKGRPMTR